MVSGRSWSLDIVLFSIAVTAAVVGLEQTCQRERCLCRGEILRGVGVNSFMFLAFEAWESLEHFIFRLEHSSQAFETIS
jgi:hypothetical protein